MQTTFTINPGLAVPGQMFDDGPKEVRAFIANANIPFGVLWEFVVVSGVRQIRPVQDADTIAQTVTTTLDSESITFSANVTLPAGQGLIFSGAPNDVYYLASAIAAGTAGTLTAPFEGTAGAGQTVTLPFQPALAGISKYDPMHEQNYVNLGGTPGQGYWRAGEMVPVVRRGRVWAQFDGTGTWPEYAAVNVWHSSTSNSQGVFTMHATQTTAGSEIDVAPSCLGIEAALAQASFTDFSGDSVTVGVVAINLSP